MPGRINGLVPATHVLPGWSKGSLAVSLRASASVPMRRGWRRWRFTSALNVAVLPWIALFAPHTIGLSPSLSANTRPTSPPAHANPVASATGPGPTRSPVNLTAPTVSRVAVGVARCTFIDHSRPVDDYSTAPATVRAPFRTLLTEIRYPASGNAHSPQEARNAAALPRAGGYPVIVFAHGYDVTPDTYAALLDDWARAGYVVVAPFFPDEKASTVAAQGANTEGDLANEPGDLAFVTHQVVADSLISAPGCPVVHHLIDATRVALAGQSDGANAVATLAYDQGLDPQGVAYSSLDADLNVQALLVLSGQEEDGRTYATPSSHVPLLVVQSRADQCNSPSSAIELYRDIHQNDKWFLELTTAHHLPPYDGVDQPAFRVVVQTTVRFLAINLKHARLSTSLLDVANRTPTIAHMYQGAQAPSQKGLPTFTGVCGTT